MARSADSTTTRTALRKTSLPSMNSVPPCSHLRRCLSEPSAFMFQLEQPPGPVDRLDHDGAGPVADDDGDLAVVHVRDPRERLGSDEQDGAGADGDEPGHGDQAVDEARAGRVDVEGAAPHADPVLHGRRRAGDDAVRRGGGEHQVSISSAVLPAQASAACAASMARPEVVPPMWRSRMPVRSTIHSSLVSRRTAMSSLVTTLSGHRDTPTGDADPLHAADPARTAWMPTKPASP